MFRLRPIFHTAAAAGIGRSINSIDQIDALQRPLTMEEGGIVLMDLLWSDPTTNDGVEGVQPSPRGPGLVTFGPDRVKEFCKVRENAPKPYSCRPYAPGRLWKFTSTSQGNISFHHVDPICPAASEFLLPRYRLVSSSFCEDWKTGHERQDICRQTFCKLPAVGRLPGLEIWDEGWGWNALGH